jgi:exopolysaccharide production protein ExoZ
MDGGEKGATQRGATLAAHALIPEIQVLRFIAAAMVLISHLQHEIEDRSFLDTSDYVAFRPIFWAGGVDIFFVISGFIMYHLAKDEFGRPRASAGFLWRRLLRVAPPYWACTVAMLLAMFLFRDHIRHASPSLSQVIGSFLFVPVPDPYGKYYPVMILGWTLNFEMLFYAIFAVGLLFSHRVGLMAIVALILAFGLPQYFVKVDVAPFAFWCNPIVFEFLFGIGLAHLRAQGIRLSPSTGWGLFVLGFALMVLAKSLGPPSLVGLWRPFWVGLPALVVCAGPALVREGSEVGPRLIWRWLVIGGSASYALYLTHPFSINLIAMLAPRIGLREPPIYSFVGFVGAIIVAVLVYVLVEAPAYAWLRHRVRRQ